MLIPRPETEELVEHILRMEVGSPRILDIGTGSGCIAISLSKELPQANIDAWDVSEEALAIARTNNKHLQASVRFSLCNALTYHPTTAECYDVIVSNPPYIAEAERGNMERNVLDWEPSTALFVPDNDPLLFYRSIGELGQVLLKPGGRLYFEINRAYGAATAALLCSLSYNEVEIKSDLSGNNRFVFAKKLE